MEWLTIKAWEYKKQAKECWHHWFAWYPITIHNYPDGAKEKVWLKTVSRKGEYELLGYVECGWVYEYRILERDLNIPTEWVYNAA